jgi:hypothetical protein
MKTSTLLLAGSVTFNLVLAALFFSGPSAPPAPAPVVAAPRPAPKPTAPGPETWAALRTDDLAAQRDRLRAEGFPPDLVRAIVAAQLSERFAGRRKALDAAHRDQPFWKNPVPDPARLADHRALAKEQSAALKALVGADPDNPALANLRRQLPNFSDERLEQLAAIRERYDEQRQALYGPARGALTPDENEKIRALEKAQLAEFATVLTPTEFEDYNLRASNVANNLRYTLSAFDVTEAEFRALYRLQSEFEDTHPPTYGSLPADQARARSEAQKKLQADIRAALGPDRAKEYERATDYDYRQSTQLVARLGLAPETANQLYTVRQETQPRLGAIYGNRDLTPADRAAQLATLNTEMQAKITAVLGPSGYEAYKSYGGSWLQSLRPPTPRPGG